jgi:hypothetical protein
VEILRHHRTASRHRRRHDQGERLEHQAGRRRVLRQCRLLGLARQLNDDDRLKLARGELKLSALWRNYRRHLAERRAQRLVAECEAADAKLDRLIARYGADRIMAALDRVTAPQRVAAE